MNFAQRSFFVASSAYFSRGDETGARDALRFPHRDDVEVVLLHDAHRVIAEAVVEGLLVVVEDFVDAQLVDGRRRRSSEGSSRKVSRSVRLKPDLQSRAKPDLQVVIAVLLRPFGERSNDCMTAAVPASSLLQVAQPPVAAALLERGEPAAERIERDQRRQPHARRRRGAPARSRPGFFTAGSRRTARRVADVGQAKTTASTWMR